MNNKQLLNRIKYQVATNKNTDFDQEIILLKRIIREENNEQAYLLLGKIYYIKKEYNLAIGAFINANNIIENQSVYLGLYKTYSAMGRYQDAYDSFLKYKNILTNQEFKSELIDSMLTAINTHLERHVEVINREQFMYFKIKNSYLEKDYNELIDNYNLGNYSGCMLNLNRLQNIADSETLPVEFNTISYLMKKIIKINIENINNKDYILKVISNGNLDELFSLFITLINNPKNNKDTIKDLFNHLVRNGYYDRIIHLLNKKTFIGADKEIIQDYLLLANEYKSFYDLNEENKSILEYIILKADYLKNNKEYKEAYDYYECGYYLTNHPIFIYYMARILYLMNFYDEALELFQKYLKLGSSKKNESIHQIYVINKNKRKVFHKLKPKEKEEKKELDYYKISAQKKLKLTVEDFQRK